MMAWAKERPEELVVLVMSHCQMAPGTWGWRSYFQRWTGLECSNPFYTAEFQKLGIPWLADCERPDQIRSVEYSEEKNNTLMGQATVSIDMDRWSPEKQQDEASDPEGDVRCVDNSLLTLRFGTWSTIRCLVKGRRFPRGGDDSQPCASPDAAAKEGLCHDPCRGQTDEPFKVGWTHPSRGRRLYRLQLGFICE